MSHLKLKFKIYFEVRMLFPFIYKIGLKTFWSGSKISQVFVCLDTLVEKKRIKMAISQNQGTFFEKLFIAIR